jgi:hypothetical protein
MPATASLAIAGPSLATEGAPPRSRPASASGPARPPWTTTLSREDKVSLTLPCMNEFDVKKRIEGEPVKLNTSVRL